jgi:hypothetical protein
MASTGRANKSWLLLALNNNQSSFAPLITVEGLHLLLLVEPAERCGVDGMRRPGALLLLPC